MSIGALTEKLSALLRDMLGRGGDDESGRGGALFTFAIRVASAGLAFLMQVLLARWLGAFDFGIYTYVWVWVNVIGTLCAVGFSTSSVRFLAEYAKPHLHGLARGFVRMGRAVSLIVGALVAALGAWLLHSFPGIAEDYYIKPLMIGMLALPAFAVTDFHDGVGRARRWIGLAFLPPYILRPLLILVFVAAFAIGHGDCAASCAATALVAATWITAGVQFLLQHRRLRASHAGARPQYQPRLWLRVSAPLLLLESFALLMMNIDVLLLKLFVGPDQIAVYFAAARTISFISFIHFAVAAVAMPRFASAFADRDAEQAATLLSRFRNWILWPSLAAAVFFLATGPFVLALFGPEFPAAWPVMFALVAGYIARAFAGPAESLLVVSGRQGYTALVTGVTAALNVALNLTLIPRFGLVGAGAATAMAFAFQAAVLALAARRTLNEGFTGARAGTPAASGA